MTTENFTTTILTASEGMFLTQADDQTNITDRIVCIQLALGRYDTPENWKEIPADEAEQLRANIQAAQEAAQEAEIAKIEAEMRAMPEPEV